MRLWRSQSKPFLVPRQNAATAVPARRPDYSWLMTSPDLRVLYNADCPVCRAEIDHYAALATRDGLPLRFDDLNGPDLALWGVTPDQAARRLHVLQGGELLSGLAAFRALWRAMPRYRWLARLTGLPGARQVATFGYDRIAAPLLYRAHLRRLRKAGAPQLSSR
jgi:predicted DCC family thiol-disulfide oxidoreductase YuxK